METKYRAFEVPDIEIIRKDDGSDWIDLIFGKYIWRVGLVVFAKVINKICKIEDDKYPYGEGGDMTKDFLLESMGERNNRPDDATIEEIAVKYKIPVRKKQ